MTRKIDIDVEKLRAVCPELVELRKQIARLHNSTFLSRKYFDASDKIDALIPAIAATMLKLAEENERMRPKANAYDLACATEKECRLPNNIEDLAARKGDGNE